MIVMLSNDAERIEIEWAEADKISEEIVTIFNKHLKSTKDPLQLLAGSFLALDILLETSPSPGPLEIELLKAAIKQCLMVMVAMNQKAKVQ